MSEFDDNYRSFKQSYEKKHMQVAIFFGFIAGFGFGALVIALNFFMAVDYLLEVKLSCSF